MKKHMMQDKLIHENDAILIRRANVREIEHMALESQYRSIGMRNLDHYVE